MQASTRTLVLAFAAIAAGCGGGSGLRCGPGTEARDGACVIVGDAGMPAVDGASSARDSGVRGDAGPATPADYTGLSIDGPYIRNARGEIVLPVGVPVTFAAYGEFPDGTSEIPSPAVSAGFVWGASPDDGSVAIRSHDGVAEVTLAREGAAQLTLSARSADGFVLSDSVRVQGVAAGASTLLVLSAQDGIWFDANHLYTSAGVENALNSRSSSSPALPAAAPVDGGAVRILAALNTAVEVRTADGTTTMAAVRTVLDPRSLTYVVATGVGVSVDEEGLVRASVPGDGTVSVSLGAIASATATVRFVASAPARALRLAWEGPVLRYAGEATPTPSEWSSPPGSLTVPMLADRVPDLPTLGWIGTMAGRDVTAFLVARHGAGDDAYFEWLPWSTTARTDLGGLGTFTARDDGNLTMQTPGVSAVVYTAGSLSIPVLVLVPYPYPTTFPLRVSPSPLTLTAPSSPGGAHDCRDLSVFVTEPGATERPLTPIEQLGVRTSTGMTPLPLDPLETRPLRPCVGFIGAPGTTAHGSLTLYWLNGRVELPVDVTVP